MKKRTGQFCPDVVCRNPACYSSNVRPNGTYSTVKSGKCQQYVCRECGTNFSAPLDKNYYFFNLAKSLKPRVARAIALWAIGFTREEIERETGVSSETVRHNLERFIKPDQWTQLAKFIIQQFQTVKEFEMGELRSDMLAFKDGLPLRERAQNIFRQMKLKAFRNERQRRALTILRRKAW